jgi:sugar-specific transcriptional regulator TrmB
MELKVNNFSSLNSIEKLDNNDVNKPQLITKEENNINTFDIYTSLSINKGSAIPEYNLILSKDVDEIKNNLKEISNSIKNEIKNIFGTDNLKEIQKTLGAEETGELDNQTIDKLSNFITADNIIKSQIDNMIKYREFEAMINLFKIQMKMLDDAIQTIK